MIWWARLSGGVAFLCLMACSLCISWAILEPGRSPTPNAVAVPIVFLGLAAAMVCVIAIEKEMERRPSEETDG